MGPISRIPEIRVPYREGRGDCRSGPPFSLEGGWPTIGPRTENQKHLEIGRQRQDLSVRVLPGRDPERHFPATPLIYNARTPDHKTSFIRTARSPATPAGWREASRPPNRL